MFLMGLAKKTKFYSFLLPLFIPNQNSNDQFQIELKSIPAEWQDSCGCGITI
jgi:hypothetical protein